MPLTSAEVREAMIFATRARRKRSSSDLVLVGPGSRIPAELLRSTTILWQRDELIARARAWASLRSHPGCRPVGLTAALLSDLPLARTPSECSLSSANGSATRESTLPAIRLDGQVISAEQRCRVR